MKIGILTINRAASYGALFQAYALTKVLSNLGHQVQVIDYMPEHRRNAYWPVRCRENWSRGRLGLNLANFRNLCDWFLFSSAIRQLLPLTRKTYHSLQELQNNPPKIDVCFFGSDQIWNPAVTGGTLDPAYFGAFGQAEMQKFAYAASFGTKSLPKASAVSLNDYLSLLDGISVRERSGLEILKKFSDQQGELVLDPTLLLSSQDYPSRRKQRPRRKYILAYSLQGKGDLFGKTVHRVQNQLYLPVIWLDSSVHAGSLKIHPGPISALNLIQNASYIVTNSFHGMTMSLVNEVDFICVPLMGQSSERTTRVTELLDEFNLCDRLVWSHDLLKNEHTECGTINWTNVRDLIDLKKRESLHFIQDMLERK